MATKQVIRGQDVTGIVQMNGNDMKFRFKSLRVEEELDDGYDQVGGEHRGRPFRVTNGFKFTFEIYQEDAKIITQWLDYIANEDASLVPLNNVLGLVFRFRDGSKNAYKVSGSVTPGPLSLGYGARGEPVMMPSTFRAQFFDAVPAA